MNKYQGRRFRLFMSEVETCTKRYGNLLFKRSNLTPVDNAPSHVWLYRQTNLQNERKTQEVLNNS